MKNVILSAPLNSVETAEEIEQIKALFLNHFLCGFSYIETNFEEIRNGKVCMNMVFRDMSSKKYFSACFDVNPNDTKDVTFICVYEVKPIDQVVWKYLPA